MTSLLANAVRREPLAAADGRSGSLLERVTLAGGQVLVVKHVLDGGDWIMQGCHDHGRAARLWSEGVLAPAVGKRVGAPAPSAPCWRGPASGPTRPPPAARPSPPSPPSPPTPFP